MPLMMPTAVTLAKRLVYFIRSIRGVKPWFFSCISGENENTNRKDGGKTDKDKFIIDTDAGADDAMAILYMLGAEKLNQNVRTVAITCANGNTALDNVVSNVLKTLKTVDRLDIPVFQGCSQPLLEKTDSDDYFGNDGFGDFEFPDPPSLDMVNKKHAVNALIRLVKKSPGEYNLLCLAPLTNIALAIRMYPSFLRDVKNIFILGGAVEGHGVLKPGIEFNFFVDPEAVVVVLKSAEELGKSITLLPSETFINRAIIPMDWRLKVLGGLKSRAMELMNKAEGKVLKGEHWFEADQLIAAVALNSSLITDYSMHPVAMETCGSLSRGALFVDYQTLENATVKIVKQVDIEAHKKLLLKYLNF